VEKLDIWQLKAQARNFAMLENLATAAGDEVNVDIAIGSYSTPWGIS